MIKCVELLFQWVLKATAVFFHYLWKSNNADVGIIQAISIGFSALFSISHPDAKRCQFTLDV